MPIIAKHPLCMKDGEFSQVRYDLMSKKGSIPYEAIISFESLFEQGFPSYDQFYSKLKGRNIDASTYKNTHDLWVEYGCETWLDLVKIYQVR